MSTQTIAIQVNGEPRDIAPGLTIVDLLSILELRADRIAVELDRTIVKKQLWAETVVPPGAEIEIVQFVGGG